MPIYRKQKTHAKNENAQFNSSLSLLNWHYFLPSEQINLLNKNGISSTKSSISDTAHHCKLHDSSEKLSLHKVCRCQGHFPLMDVISV